MWLPVLYFIYQVELVECPRWLIIPDYLYMHSHWSSSRFYHLLPGMQCDVELSTIELGWISILGDILPFLMWLISTLFCGQQTHVMKLQSIQVHWCIWTVRVYDLSKGTLLVHWWKVQCMGKCVTAHMAAQVSIGSN